MRRPGILMGALCGAMVTAALLAILFLAYALFGLPFLPFQVFDRVARTLPGSVITIGIDTVVKAIRALNLGETGAVAKIAEQSLAVIGMWISGIVIGAFFFALRKRSQPGRWKGSGIAIGLVIGLPAALIAATSEQQGTSGPTASAVWALVALLCWGLVLAWAHNRLVHLATIGAGARTAEVERIDRRRFMIKLAGATATITVAGAGLATILSRRGARLPGVVTQPWSATHPLPNAGATLLPAKGTRPEFTSLEDHYRIDINTIPPSVNEHSWHLKIGGLVQRPLELTLAQLQAYEPMHQFVTLACISNPIGGDLISTTRWTGVSLRKLLADWALQAGATHLRIHSVDGFFEVVPIDVIRNDPRVMLTYAWDGLPLEKQHGFPLRIYIPDHYGMKQPKWIESIEVTSAWEPGYWVKRGWDREARMNATSVIDTIAVNMMIIEPGKTMMVPIGGIAHAGDRGISRVELQVDGGPWQPAMLREPLSDTTWVIWRYDWPFQAGKHTFTVRCYEGDGTPQIATEQPIRPSGATGLGTKSQMM